MKRDDKKSISVSRPDYNTGLNDEEILTQKKQAI